MSMLSYTKYGSVGINGSISFLWSDLSVNKLLFAVKINHFFPTCINEVQGMWNMCMYWTNHVIVKCMAYITGKQCTDNGCIA